MAWRDINIKEKCGRDSEISMIKDDLSGERALNNFSACSMEDLISSIQNS